MTSGKAAERDREGPAPLSLGPAAAVGAVALLALAPALGPTVGSVRGSVAGQAVQEARLDQRIREARGPVSFRIPLRPGVEVCDRGIRTGGEEGWTRWSGESGGARCSTDEALVSLDVRDGRVLELELEPWSGPGDAVSVGGTVAADVAAEVLLGIVEEDRGSTSAQKAAIMAATLLPEVETWPTLLAVARDRSRTASLRRSALFWVGQAAADRVVEGLEEVAVGEGEEQEVRDAAVFALAQRPEDQAVPVLIDLARTAPHRKTRRSALFWLAQKDDPRVAGFFEEILVGGT